MSKTPEELQAEMELEAERRRLEQEGSSSSDWEITGGSPSQSPADGDTETHTTTTTTTSTTDPVVLPQDGDHEEDHEEDHETPEQRDEQREDVFTPDQDEEQTVIITPASEEPNPFDDIPQPEPQAQDEEPTQMSETLYSKEEYFKHAQAAFGVSRAVLAGALHDVNGPITKTEVARRVQAFVARSYGEPKGDVF